MVLVCGTLLRYGETLFLCEFKNVKGGSVSLRTMMQAICVMVISATVTRPSLELICETFLVTLACGLYIYTVLGEDQQHLEIN